MKEKDRGKKHGKRMRGSGIAETSGKKKAGSGKKEAGSGKKEAGSGKNG
ncbi:MAG: hypothetical protein K6F44_08865 [Lachnospiraceae bacterium]|nr:hypothetical protein [Lachnospiraceae bacterium]